MKKSLLFLVVLLDSFHSLYAGQSKLYPISGPSQLQCCSQNMYTVDVENINPTFAIQNINGKWVVRRQNQIIYEETDYPADPTLDPGQTTTFVMEIPMELLILDGLLEIAFSFDSDFDLNPNPNVIKAAAVEGCGIVRELAIQFMLTHYLIPCPAMGDRGSLGY